jgi:hypothetical protein
MANFRPVLSFLPGAVGCTTHFVIRRKAANHPLSPWGSVPADGRFSSQTKIGVRGRPDGNWPVRVAWAVPSPDFVPVAQNVPLPQGERGDCLPRSCKVRLAPGAVYREYDAVPFSPAENV